jgi:hypothetical protein
MKGCWDKGFMPFDLGRKKDDSQTKEKPEILYYAKYVGGLKKFPKEEHSVVLIFPDRIEVNPFGLKIPYSTIDDIEKLNGGKKISSDRLIALGILTGPGATAGLFWKKEHLYTVLHYNDGIDSNSLILDFGDNLKYAHPLIFERMVRSRRSFQAAANSSDFMIKSDKPLLILSIDVRNPIIAPGNEQKITVNISDQESDEKVIEAKVNGEILYPSGLRVTLEEDTTDSNGQISYSWKMNDNSELGRYGVTLHVVASGYRPSSATMTFEVRKSGSPI